MSSLAQWFKNPSVRRTVTGYVFVGPFLLGVLLWVVVPAATAGWLAFQDWDMITPAEFVGFANFRALLEDKLLLQALKVTAIYTFVSVPLGMVAGFLIALLMNSKVKGIEAFRTIYYIPSIVPAVANSVLWAWILNSEFGLLNAGLRAIGLPKILWLQKPEWALPALILMSLWGVGGSMVIYLAGLQGIPQVYYEAADIDGAGPFRKLWYITIPLMSPVIFFNLIMGVIGSFHAFTAGYLITDGGPQNSTLFYVLYMYRNLFDYRKMGYASVLAWVLFFILAAMTALIFRGERGRVHYEAS
ncbi:MAG: sugar ABC transporter permease [Anaerolineae bacterium]|nr:sugar ABC transporter permease [Anaerolineae bacterium]